MISTARADYRSYLDSSLVVIFHVIFLLFIKVVEAERKLLFSPSLFLSQDIDQILISCLACWQDSKD
ncbi:hypothetical protein E5337_02190 [Limosilactobacillus reuteri]|nr:hypothetical protein E5337_02190 [Limosilactobacillus reuteri]